MPQKVSPRGLDVHADLIGQFEGGLELLFAPEQAVEVEPHRVAVDVGVEVEDGALDGDGIVFIESRSHADVRHALEAPAETLEARGGDVDPAAGIELVG